jgi:hypothetical protein
MKRLGFCLWVISAIVCGAAGCKGDDDGTATGGAGASGASTGGAGGSGVLDASEGGSGMGGVGGVADAPLETAEETSTDAAAETPLDAPSEVASDAWDGAAESAEADEPPRDAPEAGMSAKVCAELCASDDDCARESGVQGFRCHPTTRRCSSCLDDAICIASRSLWTAKMCQIDADCVNEGGFSPFGDVCIDVDGTGYCAFFATSTTNCTSFLNTPTFSTFTVKKHGGDQRVDVCGKPSRCDADRGSCQNPCTSSTSCTPARGGKTCNTQLGRCECAGNEDCGPGAPICNLAIKQCECGSQADCSAETGRVLTCPSP